MANSATVEMGAKEVIKPSSTVELEAPSPVDSNAVMLEASLEMPFSPKVAYEAFSNFSRHGDWNSGVSGVEYVDPSKRPGVARWTMEAFGGLKIEWDTVPTALEPNKMIAWKSIKGMQLEGQAHFTAIADGQRTLMLLTSSYVVPRFVRRFFGRSNKGKRENHQVKDVLEQFRKVVSEEQAALN